MRSLTLALLLAAAAGSAAAQVPPDRGRRLFIQCQACHNLKAGAAHKTGPNLYGVAGAKAASRPGFTYSKAMAAQTLTWTDANLDRFLTKPSAMVPGTKMVFAGVAKPEDRQQLIAYLKAAK